MKSLLQFASFIIGVIFFIVIVAWSTPPVTLKRKRKVKDNTDPMKDAYNHK